MAQLEGQVAVVTGGSKGIGRAIAEALVAHGASVAIAARNEAEVEAAAKALQSAASGRAKVIGIGCDVRSHADCARLIRTTVAELSRLDILINNAGIGAFAPIADLTVETWDAVIETNLSGVFYCTHEAIPHLRAAGDSWVISIGSLAGKNAFPNGGAYNATKFGLIGFSEALMQEVRHDGIRVSYIMPGSVATEFSGGAVTGEDWKILPEDVARVVIDLLTFPSRSLPSRIELRPSRPPKR
jgi:NAD(P)-dependent dehydrogenase (short-subunit alcohol dehydrogenase family)